VRDAPGAKKTFDVLFLGRVQGHKGTDLLVRAFRALADPSLRLHIAGAGPMLSECRRLADGDSRIVFHGFVSGETRQALLDSADCLVLPSRWPDNYPISIQEAFQAGPVVIASRIGGIPEMVTDGVNGLLVQPDEEGAIGQAIERLRQSPQLAAGLRAEASRSARLSDMAFHTGHLTEAYRSLIATNRVSPFSRKAA
jgi:glycosyltransferase involved in cell wall biosynthesis